jgi:dTDP-4-amino-4,6-dideoxygalactose transaminase
MEKRIYISSPVTHGDEMQYIQEAFDRNWVAPLGFNCDAFEREICDYLEDESLNGLALSSGTAGLHLAVKLAGVKPGDIVLCADMTFAATANPITYEGGTHVFVDSERETWNMDPVALEKAFRKYPQAKVVMLVQLYGTPAKMDEILEICRAHDAILIEDAAEALGATYRGRKCGTFGSCNIISFNGNKIITTSGGGMLLTKEPAAREKALFWATQAREKAMWYEHQEIGYNYRLSNICAGIGRGQLKYIEEHRSRKEAIHNRYREAFRDLPVTMNPWLADTRPNFWMSCMTIDEGCTVDPLAIIRALAERNIEARPIWKPMHMQPVFAHCDFVTAADKPVSEDIFTRGLCLPSDINMTEEDLDKVIGIIRGCF